MSEKMNRLVCPNCGLECWTKSAYTTCDGCQTMFYASQSAHTRPTTPSPYDLSAGDKGFDFIRKVSR